MLTNIHKELSDEWNETQFTNALRDAVAAIGGYSIKLGASRFMAKGTPDTIFSLGGFNFFLESKVYPYKPSEAQKIQLQRINESGGAGWICTLKDGSIWLYDGKNHVRFSSFLEMLRYIWHECSIRGFDPFTGNGL